ncbi:MAG: protein kinase [Cylindrospermopsis raciborskii PAMP2012]|uniref:serine/threonine-protein kinase n=1 Tax=Cylindrospermopsis raciborskii TaxID=77022 RepID=UPI0022CAFDD7|nr:serine/threonine-protein kinase [Cylindrospermopsis raciborskii]MCZ2203177.1 protein kinase [Cylindrospermopsis raciborskii PAMP2012]
MNKVFTTGETIVNQDNQYQIQSYLGKGGFGYTYKASTVKENIPCVIKHFNPLQKDFKETGLRLFNREAQKLRQIEHPQIPRFIDFFEQEGEYYLIQEYIDGHDLSEEIKPGVRQNETYVIRLLKDILDILIMIHKEGLIHRDLKPSNIRRRKVDNKIVLIDFGSVKQLIAETENDNNNQPITYIHSYQYSPPEQIEGRAYSNSDIYSLGIIAICALTGESYNSPIFPNFSNRNRLYTSDRIEWHNYAPHIREELKNIIDKMVAFDYLKRYQLAEDVLTDLKIIELKSIPVTSLGREKRENPTDKPITKIDKYWINIINPLQENKIAIIGSILIGITGIIGLLHIADTPEPITQTYSLTPAQFTIKYPEKWNYQEIGNFDNDRVKFFPENTKNSNQCLAKLVISKNDNLEEILSLSEYTNRILKNLTERYPNKPIKNETTLTTIVSGKKGYKITYSRQENQCKFQILQTGTIRNTQAYELSYIATSEDYNKYLRTIESMIDSFKIIEE